MPTGIQLFRAKTEKVQSTKLTIKTPERQNLRRFGALTGNFGQTSYLVLVLFLFDFQYVNADLVKFQSF